MTKRRFAALVVAVVGTLATVAVVPPAVADHAPTYDIQSGFFYEAEGAELMQFLAPELDVHAGSTLHFTAGPHTVTALPSDVTDADQWYEDNAVGLGKPYVPVVNDPDDGARAHKYNPAVFFPPFDCGSVEQPCDYDGSDLVNSGFLFFGDPEAGYSLTVDAEPGTSFWIVCLIHPGMQLKVNVVADDAEASTQEDIEAFQGDVVDEQRLEAQSLHETLVNRRRSRRLPNGTRQWRAWAGYDSGQLALFGMFPRNLPIKRGDSVKWSFSRLSTETHTVTMPRGPARALLRTDFLFVCDPDGDEGTAPDTEADFSTGAPQCPSPEQLEIDAADFVRRRGNQNLRGPNDLEHSGVRGASVGQFSPYTVKIRTRNGGKPIVYLCIIHPFMRGRITVAKR